MNLFLIVFILFLCFLILYIPAMRVLYFIVLVFHTIAAGFSSGRQMISAFADEDVPRRLWRTAVLSHIQTSWGELARSAKDYWRKSVRLSILGVLSLLLVSPTKIWGEDIREIYRISMGDKISVTKVGEYEKIHLISSDGRIPIGGDLFVDVLGLTLSQTSAKAGDVYFEATGSKVSFIFSLSEENSEEIAIIGGVNAPGPQPKGNLSMILSRAKGLSPAATGRIRIELPDKTVIVRWYKRIIRKEQGSQFTDDLFIPSGSKIEVETSSFYKAKENIKDLSQGLLIIIALLAVL